ncbi:polysaccharide biosynthesis protein [Candidatus Pelagibacter sp.]|nr:polysaccharide biosynthesis protein [Candidatus Pelagibacter sp.]
MLSKLSNLSRLSKKLIIIFTDSILLILILWASYSIRLDQWYLPKDDTIRLILAAPIIGIPIFSKFGLYKSVIRHIDIKSLWFLFLAVSFYALTWGLFSSFMRDDFIRERGFLIEAFPRSVVIINWLLALIVIAGTRIFARYILNKHIKFSIFNSKSEKNLENLDDNKSRVLIYGAGSAGIQLASALNNSNKLQSVGFIDDNKDLQGSSISGLKISPVDDIENLIIKYKVNEVLIAIPSASRADRFNIIDKLERYPVMVRTLPGLTEIAQGKVKIDDLLQVSIKDLLGRKSVEPNEMLLGKNITNKIVLVTGAGGSIGSELCKQIIFLKPTALLLYEMNELALYSIDKELSELNMGRFKVYPLLGSVNNRLRLNNLFKRFKVDTIYHAAAYKHVPMVEFNNTEGIENNIFGTLNCAAAAIESGVKNFVLISTDKAVRPTNTMGATKRVAELILQAFSTNQNTTTFCMVRFGNVLGSSGSVIPLFKKQILDGGPVTVTDINIIRYFMTVNEAVELTIQAGAMGTGGDVFVLDMGKPVKIKELAEKLIRLSGLKVKDEISPEGDIEIKYTGLRAGEKLYEELLIGDNVSKTENPLIMRAKEDMYNWVDLKIMLDNLLTSNNNSEQLKSREILKQLVSGFKPDGNIKDILYIEGK